MHVHSQAQATLNTRHRTKTHKTTQKTRNMDPIKGTREGSAVPDLLSKKMYLV